MSPYPWGDDVAGRVDQRTWDWTTRYYIGFHRGWHGIRPPDKWLLEHQLTRLNELGVKPVLVLDPYHPDTLAALKLHHWTQHHQELRTLLSSLRSRGVRFELIDLSGSPRLVSGWRTGYVDGIHARSWYADRILRYVISKSHLSLLKPPQPPAQ